MPGISIKVALFGLITVTPITVTRVLAQVPDVSDTDHVVHLLNRITYGPRPGDIERVQRIGLGAYIDEQLNPQSLDDSGVNHMLESYTVLRYSREDLADMDRERQRLERERRASMTDNNMALPDDGSLARRRREGRTLRAEFQQIAAVRAVGSERQLYEILVEFWTNHFNVYMAKGIDRFLMPEYVEDVIRPNAMGRFRDLLGATARSPAMLFYLDNASSVAPGSQPPLLARLERRRNNLRSRGQTTGQVDSRIERLRRNLPRGINENYARELMELHTIGVEGGYTQRDVIEVARILTGWSINRQNGFSFVFNDWAHDHGPKVVMGNVFPDGHGMDEGERLLDFLASNPSTMRFVGGKLCAWFVRDDPPEGCVQAAVAAWQETDGEIRAVVRAVLTSQDFWDEDNFGNKTKTPVEFVVSGLRAVGAQPDSGITLAQLLARLGQPQYMYEAPTGYPDDAESWINSGSLLGRMNVALAIASGSMRGITSGIDSVVPVGTEPAQLSRVVNEAILRSAGSAATLAVIDDRTRGMHNRRNARNLAVALALGSPEFQRQ